MGSILYLHIEDFNDPLYLWVSMVFDSEELSVARVLGMVSDHLRLWLVRAPRRVDLSGLLAWCDALG